MKPTIYIPSSLAALLLPAVSICVVSKAGNRSADSVGVTCGRNADLRLRF